MSRITIRYVAIGILVMFLLPGAVCAQDDDSTREDNPYPTFGIIQSDPETEHIRS